MRENERAVRKTGLNGKDMERKGFRNEGAVKRKWERNEREETN